MKWNRWSLAASLALLTGCAQPDFEPSIVAAPPVPFYSEAFQQQLAGELALSAPCDRIEPEPGCQAWARGIIDYGHMREQIRSVKP